MWIKEFSKNLDEKNKKEREENEKLLEREKLRQQEEASKKSVRLQKAKLFVQIMQNKP